MKKEIEKLIKYLDKDIKWHEKTALELQKQMNRDPMKFFDKIRIWFHNIRVEERQRFYKKFNELTKKEKAIFKECIEFEKLGGDRYIHRVNLLDKFNNKDVKECINSLVEKDLVLKKNRDVFYINQFIDKNG